MNVEFKAWPKIPRGRGEIMTITEKVDGTNACVIIDADQRVVGAQSRNRLITPEDDNVGFARWAYDHEADLSALGEGYHYGEWAGPGIQKNRHNLPEKQFFLFNVGRWLLNPPPECCQVVRVLYEGPADQDVIQRIMDAYELDELSKGISPEGVVIWYHKARRYEKWTFENPDGKYLTS